ncbi:addiction module killer protein [Paludibacter sp. 221]|uniref:type II toxin-antitoxin system RelE/ParE family toxin n=1 Tax=Paludibacter sp. 221 TaxID=2302939 RepID=UPI0013D74121|nr:type II toxin-antitoxin system RelE/ParE family toxin [Paludibacter sp. 221]NDV47803.1 addiction module killer protein [Paludibacter sp. 221]
MNVVFGKEYLCELYEQGKTSNKKYRFQPEVIKKYKRCIDILISTSSIESLFAFNSLRYEVLSGDKKGTSSIRVNDQYRIEFIVSNNTEESTITICTIIELSNHYK